MDFAEREGIQKLTMRALGQLLDVDATAIYRHFPSKESLVEAMLDALLAESAATEPVGDTPQERIMSTAIGLRNVFHAHPQLTTAFATASGTYPSGLALSQRLITELRAIGVQGQDIVQMYQTIEGFIMGSATFDSGGSPDSFEQRARRYRYINEPEFDVASNDANYVRKIAEDAFIITMQLMIGRCELLAQSPTQTG